MDARGRKGDLPTYSTGVLSPLAIFDQYYKNQPTDFLREILPPRVPEYFITVHVPAAPQRMPRPFFPSPAGTERKRGREGTKRNGKLKKQRRFYTVLLRRVQNLEKFKQSMPEFLSLLIFDHSYDKIPDA